MAKIKEAIQKQKIQNVEDIDNIEWARENDDPLMRLDARKMNERYDLFDVPDHIRKLLFAKLLEWGYETYRLEHYRKFRKTITQNNFAAQTVGIDSQLYSVYKTGIRFPGIDNIDQFASFFGPIVYDILGMPRRMPRDRDLNELIDIMMISDAQFRAEMLERARNYVDNKANQPTPA